MPAKDRRVPRVLLLAMGGAFLCLYWTTLSYDYSGDGLVFASAVDAVRDGSRSTVALETLLHSHHLLYNPLVLAVHLLCEPGTRAVLTMGMVNGVIGATALVLFLALGLRLGLSLETALLAAVTLGVTHAFWVFAVSAEVYGLAQATIFVFLLSLVSLGASPGPVSLLRAAAAWVLAVLGHITSVLLAAPLLVWLWITGNVRRSPRVILLAGTVTLAVYVLAAGFLAGDPSPAGVARFIRPTGYIAADYLDWNVAHGFYMIVVGTAAAFSGGNPLPFAVFLTLGGVAFVLGHSVSPPGAKDTRRAALVTAWAAPYLPLFAVWAAGSIELTVWLLPPLALAVASAVSRVPASATRRVLLLGWSAVAAWTGAANYQETIGPASNATNAVLETTGWLGQRLRPQDLLVVGVGADTTYRHHLPYFTGRSAYWLEHRSRLLGEGGWAAELAALRDLRDRGEIAVYCLGDVREPQSVDTLVRMGVPAVPLRAFLAEFTPVDRFRASSGRSVELLRWTGPEPAAEPR